MVKMSGRKLHLLPRLTQARPGNLTVMNNGEGIGLNIKMRSPLKIDQFWPRLINGDAECTRAETLQHQGKHSASV